MIVYFSTVVREAPIENGGEIIRLEWEKKRILGRYPIVPNDPHVVDPNPRGGTRGGRGILLNGEEVIVGSYHTLHVFDRNLNPIRKITNPLFSNIHELSWDGEHIWVTSTDIDAAIKVDNSGRTLETWWPREDQITSRQFDLKPLDIDKSADNRVTFVGIGNTASSHVHLNAAAIQHDSRPVMLLNKYGSIVRLNPTEVLVSDQILKGSHNICATRCGHLLIGNTHQRSVDVYDTAGNCRKRIMLDETALVKHVRRRHSWTRLKCWLAENGWPFALCRKLFGHARIKLPIFVRGLCEVSDKNILVGISPATILHINWETGELVDYYRFSNDLSVCVHGLTCES